VGFDWQSVIFCATHRRKPRLIQSRTPTTIAIWFGNYGTVDWVEIYQAPPHATDLGENQGNLDENARKRNVVGCVRPDAPRFGRPVGPFNRSREVKRLSGLLPSCASCKKIKNDQGHWQEIESYISDHSESDFSHGICPDCAKKLYPEFADELLKKWKQTGN
jgi:hypothetical protein